MVEEARLESVYTPKGYHEFESRSLRNNERIPVMHTGITGIFIAQLIYYLFLSLPPSAFLCSSCFACVRAIF